MLCLKLQADEAGMSNLIVIVLASWLSVDISDYGNRYTLRYQNITVS